MSYDPNRPARIYGGTEREIDRTADKAADTAENVKDKAQQVAGDVRDKAQEIGSQAADRADEATTTVGTKMTEAAQTLRQRAPSSGPMADAADKAAETLDRAGSYLQRQDLNDMRADLEGVIRRYPIESLLVGLGIGYLLARSARR